MKKFMNRTTGLKALCGFIVGAAVLFAACSDPLSPSLKAGITTAPGTGQVRVSIAGTGFAPAASVRTIYPTKPVEATLHYVYTFTKDEVGAEPQELTPTGNVFTLTTGDWNLTVTAWLEEAHDNLIGTGSTGAAFTVTVGGSTPVSVTLEPEKSTGSGTLTYTVTYPATATLVSLTWEKLGVVGDTDLISTATTNTAGTLSGTETSVDVGYYVITAALTESGGETAGKKEVVHIYDNLTTEAAFTFTADDFTEQKVPVSINATNLSNLSALIAAEASSSGGGLTSDDPIIVSLAIADETLLEGINGSGTDPLHILFDAIPTGVYVAYDLSGCTFPYIYGITSAIANARSNKANLVSITIGDSVISIGNYAFYRCSGLASVTIGDSVTSIGTYAFSQCSSLASVTIGDSVDSIASSAFSQCSSLVSVTIPDSVDSIASNAFSQCSILASVTIGDSVISIGTSAFQDCSSLASVTIGDSVDSIGNSAFRSCSSLTSVTIPDSVTSIGNTAFRDCTNLTSVYVLRETPSLTTLGTTPFQGTSASLEIYVPAGVVSDYQTAWGGSYTILAGSPPAP
ncbi:hypothetical protein FACS1894109_18230 [Spirochaetia bacterium]|nr:hypothetical protein FACS1894109_18230 [Spirochaetia bacterium]